MPLLILFIVFAIIMFNIESREQILILFGIPIVGLLFYVFKKKLDADLKTTMDRLQAPARIKEANRDRERIRERAKMIIQKHLPELTRNRAKLVVEKGYGKIDKSGWIEEVTFFINDVIKQDSSVDSSLIYDDQMRAQIDQMIDEQTTEREEALAYHSEMDGYEYEHYCAAILNANGWKATVSQASGDQGVDVVAIKGEKKVAIQCKKWESAVGNKAVQEVYSGATFIGVKDAVVVSNADYTKSARELAQTLGVRLLHHEDLFQLKAS